MEWENESAIITCPHCGRELKITDSGAVVAVGTIFDKEPDKQLAQAIKARRIEFGIKGGEC